MPHHDPERTILLLIAAGVFCAMDLMRTLRTGRARLWPSGIATREDQPEMFRWHIYGQLTVLMLCTAALIWVTFWRNVFG